MFCHHQKFFSLKTFEVALQCLFNVFILFNTVFYFKLNFKLKIDPKMCTFKNLEEILKNWRKFAKSIWQPCIFIDINIYFSHISKITLIKKKYLQI